MINLIPEEPEYCIDLGSGWGGLLVQLSKKFPSAKIIGYEVSWFPYLFSKWVCRKKNIKIYRSNHLLTSFPTNAVFFCYLCPLSMKDLAMNVPKSGWLISHTFSLPNVRPIHTQICEDRYRTRVYVYRLSNSKNSSYK